MSTSVDDSASSRGVRLALTIGDVAGVGPEVVVRSVVALLERCDWRFVIVGSPAVILRAARQLGHDWQVVECKRCGDDWSTPGRLVVWNPSSAPVEAGAIGLADARAGRAAYDWLVAATRAALDGTIDAIVTAPLNKLGRDRFPRAYGDFGHRVWRL